MVYQERRMGSSRDIRGNLLPSIGEKCVVKTQRYHELNRNVSWAASAMIGCWMIQCLCLCTSQTWVQQVRTSDCECRQSHYEDQVRIAADA